MKVIVNGFEEHIAPGINLATLIREMREQGHGLIVEVNGRFVYPGDYEKYEVKPGDKIEMIHPGFGG